MFKKLWKWILLIIIIIVAIYFPAILTTVGGWLSTFFTGTGLSAATIVAIQSLPWWVGAAAAIGSAYVLAPETTSELVNDIGNGAKDIADTVVDVGASVAGSVFDKLAPFLLGGAAIWFFFFKEKKQPVAVIASPVGESVNEEER